MRDEPMCGQIECNAPIVSLPDSSLRQSGVPLIAMPANESGASRLSWLYYLIGGVLVAELWVSERLSRISQSTKVVLFVFSLLFLIGLEIVNPSQSSIAIQWEHLYNSFLFFVRLSLITFVTTLAVCFGVRGEEASQPSSPKYELWRSKSKKVNAASQAGIESDAVAIIGYALRFPGGVCTPDQFWDLLINKRCVTEEMSPERWNLDRFYSPDERTPGRFGARRFGLVKGSDSFDPAFFNISAADAEAMDPQQRMFLVCVVEALERAGIPLHTMRGTNTGVWVGTSVMEYLAVQAGSPGLFNAFTNPGVALCVIANRVSFFLGTRGPSMAVDTACASSLTALDFASRYVREGICDMAIVGGTNALLLPEMTVSYSHMGVLAKDGRCKSFDARADGYARAEGYGCVVIKRQSLARRDGNPVIAIVRACGSNANGDQTTGLTKPSSGGQGDLIRQTWASAGMDMADVDYVEAHGTGTAVGDPIEANAIALTLGRAHKQRGLPPLPICSCKANLGHMEPAAAIGSLIKACLMIERRALIPQALFEIPHPDIDWEGGGLCVLKEPTPARPDSPGHPLTIAINAFGFGGSNSHAILQAPSVDDSKRIANVPPADWQFGKAESSGRDVCVPFSAASSDSLHQLAARWSSFKSSTDAMAVAASASARRTQHIHRAVIIAGSAAEFKEHADHFAAGVDDPMVVSGKALGSVPKLCFVFSGQGPQYADMGRFLFSSQSLFCEFILNCDQLFSAFSGRSFVESSGLFLANSTCTVDMDRPDAAQPAICFFQMGVCHLLESWGVTPSVIVGHSVGEVAAAWAAKRLSLPDAVRLIYARSQQQQRTEGKGGMLAVACPRERLESILKARGLNELFIAAVNSPNSVTVGGTQAQIKTLRSLCKEIYNLQSAVLGVRCAYHTPQMEPIREGLLQDLQFLSQPMTVADDNRNVRPSLFSSVTGALVANGSKLDGEYWWKNVREEVNFLGAMESILNDPLYCPDVIVEISCRSVLASLVRQSLGPKASTIMVTSIAERAVPEQRQLLHTAASLYVRGVPVFWHAIVGHAAPMVTLPDYPFREERYSKEAFAHSKMARGGQQDPFKAGGMHLSVEQFPFLADHVVGGNVILSGTTMLEMIFETICLPSASSAAVMLDIQLSRAAPLDHNNIDMSVCPRAGGFMDVFSGGEDAPVKHCSARLPSFQTRRKANVSTLLSPWALQEGYSPLDFLGCSSFSDVTKLLEVGGKSDRKFASVDVPTLYKSFGSMGYLFGPQFALVARMWAGDEEAIFVVKVPASCHSEGFRFHPAVLDACVHGALFCIGTSSVTYVPSGIAFLDVSAPLPRSATHLVVHARIRARGAVQLIFDVDVCHPGQDNTLGSRLVTMRGLELHTLVKPASSPFPNDTLYRLEWQDTRSTIDISSVSACFRDADVPHQEQLKQLRLAQSDLRALVAGFARAALAIPGARASQKYTESVERLAAMTDTHLNVDEMKALEASLRLRLPFYKVELDLIQAIGSHMCDILASPGSVADVMYRPELLPLFFRDSFTVNSTYEAIAESVVAAAALMCNDGRVVRILEVGVRTGGLAMRINERLSQWGQAGLVEYVASDLATTFFADAATHLDQFPWVKLQRYNLEVDSLAQGMATASFDIIVVFSTLHGMTVVQAAVAQLANVLSPGGLLLNVEPSEPDQWWLMEMWFAGLEVWWRMTDFRSYSAHYTKFGRQYETCWMTQGEWIDQFQEPFFDQVIDVGRKPQQLLFNGLIARRAEVKSTMWPRIKTSSSLLIIAGSTGLDLTALKSALLGHADGQAQDVQLCQVQSKGLLASAVKDALERQTKTPTILILPGLFDITEFDAASEFYVASLEVIRWLADGGRKGAIVVATENGCQYDSTNPLAGWFQGFCRAAEYELEGTFTTYVQISDPSSQNELKRLADVLCGVSPGEGEMILQNDSILVPRLHRYAFQREQRLVVPSALRLESDGSSGLDGVRLCAFTLEESPAPGYVLIDVENACLNFKDVLLSLGLLSGLDKIESGLGVGCAGRIAAVGEGVSGLSIGDTVVSLASQCLATQCSCDARLVAKVEKPEELSASMLGCVTLYVTAYDALMERAKIKAGDTVLIHSCASGVGQCAVQIAQAVGCKVIATAGTEGKRAFVRDVLKVDHVSDSRDPAVFLADVTRWTGGSGVDVVLNCLAGRSQEASLRLCRPGGRFVEIGKRDMLEHNALGQHALLHNISLLSCQVDLLANDNPGAVRGLLCPVLEMMAAGTLKPIMTESVPLQEFASAIQRASRGDTIAKTVFEIKDRAALLQSGPVPLCQAALAGKGAYIITGGLGGIGLVTARMLALRGAGHIVLVSRSASNPTRRQQNDVDAVERLGAKVHLFSCDVQDRAAVQNLVDFVCHGLHLRVSGVLHLAACLSDGLAWTLNPEQLLQPARTKLQGAINLHLATEFMPLDAFMVTVSGQDLYGLEQSSYVAANTACIQLMHCRRRRGLAACAVALGPVLGAGMVEREQTVARILASRGSGFISVEEASNSIVECVCLPKIVPVWLLVARIDGLVTDPEQQMARGNTKWLHLLRKRTDAAGPASAEDCLNIARKKVGEIFCLAADDVDPSVPLLSLGVDSLVATELLAFFRSRLRLEVSYTDILAGVSLQAIVDRMDKD